MIDIQQLKTTVDLRVLAEQELGRPVSRGSRAWTFKCPFHAESKGASLSVYQDGWKCWGACQESGDLLTWVAKRHQLNIHQPADFAEVVRLLGGSPDVLQRRTFHHRVTTKASTVSEPTEPPSAAWQGAASDIVERAERNLWSRAGQAALDYLLRQRGLWPHVIREARLGYVNDSSRLSWEVNGLAVPTHSITIPWFADGQLWGIKCRRLAGDEPRYKEVSATKSQQDRLGKSNLHGALYWADLLIPRWPVLVVEGEFNCLAAWQAAGHLIRPVSLGPSGSALNPRWFAHLLSAPAMLAWFDRDSAGQKGAERLAGLAGGLGLIQFPKGLGKDINDFWLQSRQQGYPAAVTGWLAEALQVT